jgi:hypothetical protein
MQRFSPVDVLTALITTTCLSLLVACGGSGTNTSSTVASIVLSPTSVSMNEGDVVTISAIAQNSTGGTVVADLTFTSSNPSVATLSTGGSICAGKWDSAYIVCTPTLGQAGVGQVTVTVASGNVKSTMTAYVHLHVDRVVVNPLSGCTSMGQVVPVSTVVYSTSAPGCSPAAPCDITTTVGPIVYNSNDLAVVANSAGVEPTFSSTTNSPTYTSGGTTTGTTGQTCTLTNFGVATGSGINPVFSPTTNSPTYTSGGSITGSAGQNCNLSNFNGVDGATATVVLTAANTIASGTHLTITAEGSGGTSPPTTATLSNGTANCSGTANVITALNTTIPGFGVIGAMATVALTGKNVIASGTHLTVSASGYGATTPPTTATLSNGSASCSGTANVVTALTPNNGLTAQGPGSTTVFASVSGVNSVGVPSLTCPVVTILVHDLGSQNTSFTLAPAGTQPLTADVYDSNGVYIKPTLTWGSSSTATATVAAGTTGNNTATVTAVAPGTAYITASCSYPDCNRNLPPQFGLNEATVSVSGFSSTTVYAASTGSLMLVPISTATDTAGTVITLPYVPNSMVAAPNGSTLYLGSSSGLMGVNLSTNAVSTLAGVNGIIAAISADGNYLLLSDSTVNSIRYVSLASLTQLAGQPGDTTNSSAYSPDSKSNEWLDGNQLGIGFPTGFVSAVTLPYTGDALDLSGPGGLTYISSSSGQLIDVRATCNQAPVQVPALPANHPTLLKAIPNGAGAVASDSPAIDVVTTGAIPSACPPAPPNSIASYDLGAGSFTARQLFVSPSSSNAWIVSDLPELLSFNLTSSTASLIPLIGGASGLDGGITPDGTRIYLGTSDNTVHRVDASTLTDTLQIPVGLKDASGNAVAPNLVTVVP